MIDTLNIPVKLCESFCIRAQVYALRIFPLYSRLMILARSLASTSLTNKGERSRVYDVARFNKREAERLGKIFETVVRLVFIRKVAESKQDSTSRPRRLTSLRISILSSLNFLEILSKTQNARSLLYRKTHVEYK